MLLQVVHGGHVRDSVQQCSAVQGPQPVLNPVSCGTLQLEGDTVGQCGSVKSNQFSAAGCEFAAVTFLLQAVNLQLSLRPEKCREPACSDGHACKYEPCSTSVAATIAELL
eukprot:jgi/Ulvmu1/4955/UM206_0007.1